MILLAFILPRKMFHFIAELFVTVFIVPLVFVSVVIGTTIKIFIEEWKKVPSPKDKTKP